MLEPYTHDEKPDTLTAALYIIGFILCGYFIITALLGY
jgi:hypothetical protein